MAGGKTLVIGGGGVAGVAWVTGLLLGLSERGVMLGDAELIIGTSAGATVAAQLDGGLALEALYARQVDPALQVAELTPAEALYDRFLARFTELVEVGDIDRLLIEMGRLALDAPTVDEAVRRAVIEARLPSHQWPMRPIRLVAVDARSGETRIFDRESGVGLVDAVAASCAVPGVWPPVTIGLVRYIDGGVRSTDNVDLATGCERALVIAPRGSRIPFTPGRRLLEQLAELESTGVRAFMIEPDKPSRTAIGSNPLTPETRPAAAEMGRAQGRSVAEQAGAFWTSRS
jgi:NTE family protein